MQDDVLVAFVKEALDRRQAEMGLNEDQFAQAIGIDYTTLYRIKRGMMWPPSLKAVARVLAPQRDASVEPQAA